MDLTRLKSPFFIDCKQIFTLNFQWETTTKTMRKINKITVLGGPTMQGKRSLKMWVVFKSIYLKYYSRTVTHDKSFIYNFCVL